MREIKFRGRDTFMGEMRYGFYVEDEDGANIMEGNHAYLVDRGSVAQFVGYDSNGTALYEGDEIDMLDAAGARIETGLCDLCSWVEETLQDTDFETAGCKIVLKA